MTTGDVRFEVFRDPTDSWVVWDCERETFASLGAETLYGLAETYARAICNFLNITRDTRYRPSRPWLRPVPSSR